MGNNRDFLGLQGCYAPHPQGGTSGRNCPRFWTRVSQRRGPLCPTQRALELPHPAGRLFTDGAEDSRMGRQWHHRPHPKRTRGEGGAPSTAADDCDRIDGRTVGDWQSLGAVVRSQLGCDRGVSISCRPLAAAVLSESGLRRL